jgi:hypothetical protein
MSLKMKQYNKKPEIMQDSRQHKRFKVDNMDITGEMMFDKEVNIIDISLSGICLKTDRRLNIGTEYRKVKDKVIDVPGTVIRSLLSELRKDVLGNSIPVYCWHEIRRCFKW